MSSLYAAGDSALQESPSVLTQSAVNPPAQAATAHFTSMDTAHALQQGVAVPAYNLPSPSTPFQQRVCSIMQNTTQC